MHLPEFVPGDLPDKHGYLNTSWETESSDCYGKFKKHGDGHGVVLNNVPAFV